MTLTAVLFVGGESRRMGVDKATLLIAGEPLWARQLRILRELKPEKILISARTRTMWCPPEIEVVLDEPPSRGPLSGLNAALKQIQTTHLLALAVDLPQMNVAQLQKLWRQAGADCGVMPGIGQELEPLCAIYPGGTVSLAAVAAALAGPDFSLRHFARGLIDRRRMTVMAVSDSERGCYLNVNTPAALSSAG